ncbi:VOC family protein [Microbacterium halotolerans]|uniref:VOC family protein n=1 Tax=Microbacterium halotolerans TaxID=246613 RepID=UPI000E6AA7C0
MASLNPDFVALRCVRDRIDRDYAQPFDVDAQFARIQAHEVEVIQEPTDQPYGVRDGAFRDPTSGSTARLRHAQPDRTTTPPTARTREGEFG